ncbi:methyltransferase SAM dependent [Luminiphilus syltensis NOR5-1B]|uniref:tRNA (guanine(46)-N(7))-methyltransferase n=2 Tax=Luminiphilus TaxID=1341118 RepID=B8KUU7_9GAMM|nr:methyltransferase SAM dependent [Luminiphilus syltensis NOR5-1B]
MTPPQTSTPSPIVSDQPSVHPDLENRVLKHLRTHWQKPIPDHTRAVADQLIDEIPSRERPLILDSFCGTGMSSGFIAQSFPDHWVIGVDQSAHRLDKHQLGDATNYQLVRAECETLWQCLVEAGVTVTHHFLLYPNPWPKAAMLNRRIHGHPSFPLLARLGGRIELRSNWSIYVSEFARAARLIGIDGTAEAFTPTAPITLFERKYQQKGQTLWRFLSQDPP